MRSQNWIGALGAFCSLSFTPAFWRNRRPHPQAIIRTIDCVKRSFNFTLSNKLSNLISVVQKEKEKKMWRSG